MALMFFLKLVCFGSKICIESIKIGLKAIHRLQSRENLRLLLPFPHFMSLDWVPLDESFSKSVAGFKK